MIIDAMDILYSGRVDGFCIVSSDSDFTRLAIRLREAGMKVFGFGERKTPISFISACDKFIYIEILKADLVIPKPIVKQARAKKTPKNKTVETVVPVVEIPQISTTNRELIALIKTGINDLADEEGWAFLGDLGNLILKRQPDFDPRNYGFKKLVPLIKSLNFFEIDERTTGKNNTILVYVKNK